MRLVGILLGGLLYALALPPVDQPACAWLALVPLLLVVRDQPLRSAFAYGCLFGYAYGWSSMWSLAEAVAGFFQMPLPFAVAAVGLYFFGVGGLPAGCFSAGSAVLFRSLPFAGRALAIPSLWVACEVIRARVIEQPWDLLGYTQHGSLALIQVAAFTGVYGVSFLIALGAVAVAESTVRFTTKRRLLHVVRPLAIPTAVVIVVCWMGNATLRAGIDGVGPVAGTLQNVSVVQTNLAPALHWTPGYTAAQVTSHLNATAAIPSSDRPALIVWPENAVPRYLEADPMLASTLSGMAQRERADLLFGAPRHDGEHVFNSVRLITSAGRNGGHYDKRRLVWLAERKPWASPTGLEDPNPTVFASGTDPGVLESFVRLGVSVCHEVIHPDLIADSVRHGAELLVNVANDSWITGPSQAPAYQQHLAMAVFRAVETRRYLVRAALTGMSAVVDPFGRILGALPPEQRGILTIPVRGIDSLTWYVRFHDAFAWVCVLVAMTALLAFGRRGPRSTLLAS